MTREQTLAAVQAAYDALNDKQVDVLDQYFAENYENHHPFPGQLPGRENLKQLFLGLIAAFPDLHVDIEDVVIDGDKVAVRMTMRGTDKGGFMGAAATGNTIDVSGIELFRVEDGIVQESWVHIDTLALLQQLGMIPAP